VAANTRARSAATIAFDHAGATGAMEPQTKKCCMWRSLLFVAISERTRKILWAKAGGRCSICRVLLVTEGTDTDDPSVFGQEAHIISEAAAGPRAGDRPGHDAYDNLILLCSKDHKRIDDQVGHYTPELLRQIRRDHEEWVTGLGESNGPVRLVPDPAYPIAKTLRVCMTASSLWNLMGDAHIFYPSWPDGLSEEQQDLITNFLDDLRDWRDVASMEDGYQVGGEAAKGLQSHVQALQEAGLLIGARKRHCLLTGGVAREPSPWRTVDIEIQPLSIAQVIDGTGARIWPPVSENP
jgi:5-methylcytosine-specific restriction endonuclease McrA